MEKAITRTARKGGSVKTGVKVGKKDLTVDGGHPDYYGAKHAKKHIDKGETTARKAAQAIVTGQRSKDGDGAVARGKKGSKAVLFNDGKKQIKLNTAYKDKRP